MTNKKNYLTIVCITIASILVIALLFARKNTLGHPIHIDFYKITDDSGESASDYKKEVFYPRDGENYISNIPSYDYYWTAFIEKIRVDKGASPKYILYIEEDGGLRNKFYVYSDNAVYGDHGRFVGRPSHICKYLDLTHADSAQRVPAQQLTPPKTDPKPSPANETPPPAGEDQKPKN